MVDHGEKCACDSRISRLSGLLSFGSLCYESILFYAAKKKGNLPLLGVVSVGIDDDVSW